MSLIINILGEKETKMTCLNILILKTTKNEKT